MRISKFFPTLKRLSAILFVLSLPCFAFSAAGVSYHGRILRADSTPVDGQFVGFRIRVMDGAGGTCEMYQETHTKDMRLSNGAFSIVIGDGSAAGTFNVGGVGFFDEIFQNDRSFSFTTGGCVGTPYVAGSKDGRKLAVEFRETPMSAWETLPPMPIAHVPFAFSSIVSKKVGIHDSSSLLRVENAGTPAAATALTSANMTELMALLGGTTTQYIKSVAGTAGEINVSTTSGAATVSLPTIGTLTPGTYGSSTQIPVFTVDAKGRVTGVTNTAAAGGGGGITDLTGDVTASGAGSVVATIANNAVTTAKINNGAVTDTKLASDAVTTVKILDANVTLVKLAADSVNSSKIVDGSITGSDISGTAALSVASVAATGNVGAGTMSTRSIGLFENPVNGLNNIIFQAPANLAGDSVYTWPSAAPGSNMVLQSDSSGNLSWVADATGGAPGDASYAAKGIVQFDTDLATSGITVTGGVAKIGTGGVSTGMVANDAITYAKIQNVTDARLIGRSAGSAGDAQEITVGSGLSLSAGTLTATGAAVGDATYAAKGIVQLDTDAATSGLALTSGVMKLATSGVAANTYGSATSVPVIVVDAFGRITSASSTAIALNASAINAGILPIARGGTNSGTALNDNRLMVSSGGAIVEAAALANGQLLIGSTGAAPVAGNITGTGITVANGAGTIGLSIANDAVTYAKMQDMTDNKILGRSAGSAGDPQEITIGSGLTMSAGTLSATASAPGDASYAAKGLVQFDTDLATSGITVASGVAKIGTGGVSTGMIATDAVTTAKILNLNVTTGKVADDAITFAKMQNVSTNKLLGRGSALSGDVEEITLGTGLSLSGTTLNSSGLSAITNTANLADTKIWIGDSGGKAQEFPLSGDATMTAGGVVTVDATSANTASKIMKRDVSGNFVAGTGQFSTSVKITDGAAGGQVTIAAPAAFTSYNLTLPADDGAANQVLQTNGSGVLSWVGNPSGLSNFTESISTGSPNNVTGAAALTATNAFTHVDAVFSPKGSGALLAQVPNNLSTGGNKRGARAVDWQLSRTSANMVASGSDSVIGGGVSNRASGNTSVVSGGNGNAATGTGSVVVGGLTNTASGGYGVVLGGMSNTASGDGSAVFGNTATAESYGQMTIGAFNLPKGGETNNSWVSTDPLFVVGNGTDAGTLSNAMMILKNGNVGIGAVNPQRKLHIFAGTGPQPSAVIERPNNTTDRAQLSFYPNGALSGSNVEWDIGMLENTTNFSIASWDGTTATERLSVKTDGNVGIGTTSPFQKLDIQGTNSDVLANIQNNSSSVARYPGILVQNYSGGVGGSPTFGGLSYRGSSASPAAVQSGDSLFTLSGMGATDTSYNSGTGAQIRMNASETFAATAGTATALGTNISFLTAQNGTASLQTRMNILNNGNVGIGPTSPTARLHVSGGQFFVEKTTQAWSSTTAVSFDNGNVQDVTLGGNTTFTFSNPKSGAVYTFIVKQDATGNRTVTWPATVKWPGGVAPVLTSTGNAVDIFNFVSDGTNYYNMGFSSDVK